MGTDIGSAASPFDALYAAIRCDDLAALQRLLPPELAKLPLTTGQTLLHVAAQEGTPGSLAFLLERGYALNARNARAKTPLDAAVKAGKVANARFLLESGGLTGQFENFAHVICLFSVVLFFRHLGFLVSMICVLVTAGATELSFFFLRQALSRRMVEKLAQQAGASPGRTEPPGRPLSGDSMGLEPGAIEEYHGAISPLPAKEVAADFESTISPLPEKPVQSVPPWELPYYPESSQKPAQSKIVIYGMSFLAGILLLGLIAGLVSAPSKDGSGKTGITPASTPPPTPVPIAVPPLESWVEFRDDAGRFSISFPGKPDGSETPVKNPVGLLMMHQYLSEDSAGTYQLIYADYPRRVVRRATAKGVLDGARNGLVAATPGKLIHESTVRYRQYSCRQIEYHVKDKKSGNLVKCYFRLFLIRNRLYALGIYALEDDASSRDLFFNSFSVPPKAPGEAKRGF